MDDKVLGTSALFHGISLESLHEELALTPHQTRRYEKGETIFLLMENATHIGVIVSGHAQAQKAFPNGSQVNVSLFGPGDVIGAAAAFSAGRRYPCDIVALEPVTVLMFRREALLGLMQRDARILENLMTEIASATYMLQQRLELLSYHGIAQKAAFWLLTRARQSGSQRVKIPGSVTRWALMMNVSRPSLHRELTKLAAQGVIAYAPPVIEILDAERLQGLLGEVG